MYIRPLISDRDVVVGSKKLLRVMCAFWRVYDEAKKVFLLVIKK
jgi:hypothetical protein